jgi:hypothetical protein
MSNVIVEVSVSNDSWRMGGVYRPVIGFTIPGENSATVELSLDQFREAIAGLNLKFVGTTTWRVVEKVESGSVNLAFGAVSQYGQPVDTMKVIFDAEDATSVREILAQLNLIENLEAFDAA